MRFDESEREVGGHIVETETLNPVPMPNVKSPLQFAQSRNHDWQIQRS